jgi:hypothetical protein
MIHLIEREFRNWQEASGAGRQYLALPAASFEPSCPPMTCIGGADLRLGECVVVVSLEPLLDGRTFSNQLAYLQPGAPGAEVRARAWQYEYFTIFPSTFPRQPAHTRYWNAISSLVHGWVGRTDSPFSDWMVLGATYVELPMIPMHARSHTAMALLPNPARIAVRRLFVERLHTAIRTFRPHTVIALGADCVAESRAALQPVGVPETVNLSPHVPAFGKSVRRYQWPIECHRRITPEGMSLVCRSAPFTRWHLPSRAGIWEIGKCIRAGA